MVVTFNTKKIIFFFLLVYRLIQCRLFLISQIQGTESIPQFTSQFEQLDSMYTEGVPDYFVDQGLYYPTATNYGYICTGNQS